MSTTYRFSFNALLANGQHPVDVLVSVHGAVNAVTVIEDAGNHAPVMGVHAFYVDFIGQNDNEARETARRAQAAIPNVTAFDAVRLHTGRGKDRRRVEGFPA